MPCKRPIRAGYGTEFNSETQNYGISFSKKHFNKELASFQLPCRKCLQCRLSQAREKAIRCYHESKMHPDNIFLTLTYDDEHLESPKLIYKHWQDFMKRLRETTPNKLPVMVTGEYGELNKRPHWHALIFNYSPSDGKLKYTSERGDKVYTSEHLKYLWPNGNSEYGNVTLDSANYVARYAAKKLVHGDDQSHDYHPIHRTSSKHGLGKSWIEKYYQHTFENGFIILPNGTKSKIPRYYVDWAKKYQPEIWLYYVTEVLPKIQKDSQLKNEIENWYYRRNLEEVDVVQRYMVKTKPEVKEIILQSKFNKLQEKLKL